MRRFVDHVLCGLPFEEDWFRQHGCRATFVGHPFFDEMQDRKLDERFLARERAKSGRVVTILPGSRTQEVEHNLHWMLKTAALVHARLPDVRFAVASFKPHQAEFARRLAGQSGLPVEVFLRRTPELIELAECCLAVSGSVSLELLSAAKPTVVLYWISRVAYFVQGFFRRVPYITLVNLLAAKELFPAKVRPFDPDAPGAEDVLFPEYLTCKDRSAAMARRLLRWLENEGQRTACIQRLVALREKVAHGGASARTADYILTELTRPACSPPRPHRVPAAHTERVLPA
jgi:lipid-A-disaccharide synthase